MFIKSDAWNFQFFEMKWRKRLPWKAQYFMHPDGAILDWETIVVLR